MYQFDLLITQTKPKALPNQIQISLIRCIHFLNYQHPISVNNHPSTNNCPSEQIIPADPGGTTASATWTVPTFTDELGSNIATSPYNPGDTFPLGETVVTYTAYDLTGNVGSCSFSIIVQGRLVCDV